MFFVNVECYLLRGLSDVIQMEQNFCISYLLIQLIQTVISYQIFARLFWVYATKLSFSCYFYFTCSFVLRERSIVQVKRGWEDVLNDDGNKDRNLEGCSPHCWKELLPIRICSCLLFHHHHHLQSFTTTTTSISTITTTTFTTTTTTTSIYDTIETTNSTKIDNTLCYMTNVLNLNRNCLSMSFFHTCLKYFILLLLLPSLPLPDFVNFANMQCWQIGFRFAETANFHRNLLSLCSFICAL